MSPRGPGSPLGPISPIRPYAEGEGRNNINDSNNNNPRGRGVNIWPFHKKLNFMVKLPAMSCIYYVKFTRRNFGYNILYTYIIRIIISPICHVILCTYGISLLAFSSWSTTSTTITLYQENRTSSKVVQMSMCIIME